MSSKNFIIKNGLTVGSTEAIDSSGDLTAAAFGTAANEAIDDRVNALLTAGTGISLSYLMSFVSRPSSVHSVKTPCFELFL